MRRPRAIEQHVSSERWLVSYADFITLLFAFFTTLYAISTIDKKKADTLSLSVNTALNVGHPSPLGKGESVVIDPAPPSPPIVVSASEAHERELALLEKDVEALARDAALEGRVKVKREARGVVLSLAEAGFFESGSAELASGGKEALDVIAERLDGEHERLDVLVEGHTDNVPVRTTRYPSNWALSTARATYVVSFFIEKHHLSPEHLAAAGYGEYKPVGGNETADGRARNRRIDLVLNRAHPAAAPATEAANAAETQHADDHHITRSERP